MKIVVDMNLSPDWIPVLAQAGHEAVHWSDVGDPRAADETTLDWALAGGYVVLTHDLDFGAILAATNAAAPSVIQVRAQDVLAAHLGGAVVSALTQFADLLETGALIVLHEDRAKARVLPLRPRPGAA